MNKIFTAIIVVISTVVIAAQPIHNLDPYNPKYASKTIILKFKDSSQLSNLLGKSTGNQFVLTGITSIDELSSKYKFISYEKVFKNSVAQSSKKFFKDHSGIIHEVANLDKIYKIHFDSEIDPKQLVDLLKADENIDYAEPDYIVYTMLTPNDSLYQNGEQWYLNAVDALAAWDITVGDTTQIIAILDTGVDGLHPDLVNKIWTNPNEIPGNGIDDDHDGFIDDIHGWDFINNDNDPMDDNSHGTHVAGIAAAQSNNGKGIAGIAWNAKIMPIKVLQSSGEGNSSDVAAGVLFAANHGATVINMSLGSYGESLTLKNALAYAYSFATLVAAAGNDGFNVDPLPPPYAPLFPACYSFVLGVMASGQNGGLAAFSNIDPSGPIVADNAYGYNYEVMAPGVDIWSTIPHNRYKSLSGTSMATPIVSGTVALMRSFMPKISNEDIFAKLIQSSNNGLLDIKSALNFQLSPDMYFVNYTIVDTLPGDDRDGIADVGETIEVFPTIKNAGGTTDSVWAKLSFSEFEDTTTAVFINNISYLGKISTYAQLSGNLHPWKLTINPNLVDNRIITFNCEIYSGTKKLLDAPIKIKVQKIFAVSGMITQDQVWTPDKIYVITDNTRVIEGVTLQVKPGTIIQLYPGKSLEIRGILKMIGKPDSLITFTSNDVANPGAGLLISNNITTDTISISYVNYHHLRNIISAPNNINVSRIDINNSIFSATNSQGQSMMFIEWNASISRCNFLYNNCEMILGNYTPKISENLFFHNYSLFRYYKYGNDSLNFFDNTVIANQDYFISFWGGNASLAYLPNNYWGTTNEDDIKKNFYDFNVDATLPLAVFTPILTRPSKNAHGHVWKVLVNNKNPQEETIDPVGSEKIKFDVYFNRAMDIKQTPFLTFGVRDPFTQRAVKDSAYWNADSTVWTAYYNVDLATGDGINTIRVALALDNEHFQIPEEYTRFRFVIQAAGALSNEFNAYSNPGKIMLIWPAAKKIDILGYNMYRYENITDTTFTNKIKINNSLITDTVYNDTNILPGKKYHYMYSVIGTDLQESDLSKEAVATAILSVNLTSLIPNTYSLYQNYPNPFNPSTVIKYALPFESNVNIKFYNSIGQCVRVINEGIKQAGYYELNFNSSGLASGIYFYWIKAASLDGKGNFNAVKKMILLK